MACWIFMVSTMGFSPCPMEIDIYTDDRLLCHPNTSIFSAFLGHPKPSVLLGCIAFLQLRLMPGVGGLIEPGDFPWFSDVPWDFWWKSWFNRAWPVKSGEHLGLTHVCSLCFFLLWAMKNRHMNRCLKNCICIVTNRYPHHREDDGFDPWMEQKYPIFWESQLTTEERGFDLAISFTIEEDLNLQNWMTLKSEAT